MLIVRKSMMTGIERTRNINVTPAQLRAWEGGALIQEAMPNLTSEEREFLMTGITQEEWDANIANTEE
jgi:hypothetical protein